MLCQRYNCLPEAGGLYDQDAELIAKFKVLDEVFQKKQKFEDQKAEMQRRAREAAGGSQ